MMAETVKHLMDCGFNVLYGFTESDEISILFNKLASGHLYTLSCKNNWIVPEALPWCLIKYLPPGKRGIAGVIFATEKARRVAEAIMLSQIRAGMIIVAPDGLLYDQTAKTGWEYSSSLMEAMYFRSKEYLMTYPLRNEKIERPIDLPSCGERQPIHESLRFRLA
jgi:hypothetical protein